MCWILLFLFLSFPLQTQGAFQMVEGIKDPQIQKVMTSPFEQGEVFVASKNALYRKRKEKFFERMCTFTDETVQDLFADRARAGVVYVATTRHLYRITESKEILFTVPDEAVIKSAFQDNGVFYVGTTQGLYTAIEDTRSWKVHQGIGEVEVTSFAMTNGIVYIGTRGGVFSLDETGTCDRVLVLREDEEGGVVPTVLYADQFDQRKVWLGTSQGLLMSGDYAQHWQKCSIEGIDGLWITDIAQHAGQEEMAWIATSQGVFSVDDKLQTAAPLFEGLPTTQVNDIAFDAQGYLLAATARGLFRNDYFTAAHRTRERDWFAGEPAIGDVQQAALRYNEVHPDKIKRWRTGLRVRALFPEITLDYDKTIGYSVSKSGEFFSVGPRDWGVSFSWDVGDLVWNTYEDDVDTRARLNTQLRLDILDEVNRLYFERIRLKRALEEEDTSESERLKKELRFYELTAIIDGYTGGYFSRETKELNEHR